MRVESEVVPSPLELGRSKKGALTPVSGSDTAFAGSVCVCAIVEVAIPTAAVLKKVRRFILLDEMEALVDCMFILKECTGLHDRRPIVKNVMVAIAIFILFPAFKLASKTT